ncbi:MAG: SDR family oxidoreductase [Chitinophagaceae bacterium]|nr:SDR family oxidoreductase [Chitinophagaceae bacterium]
MNILIFGASGKTGKELVAQALGDGHTVTAFVRTPEKLTEHHEKLTIIQGDVGDYAAVERTIRNQDVVLSALGVSRPLKKDPVVVQGVSNIIKAMEKMNVKRFIYLSFLGVDGAVDAGFMIRNIISRIVRNEIEDHEEKERLITSSSLAFTIVRPPKLTNGSKRGSCRSGEAIKSTSILPSMSRKDVAHFMLKQISDDAFLHKAVRIMY